MSDTAKRLHFSIVVFSLILLTSHFLAHRFLGDCLWWRISPVLGPVELAFGILAPIARYFDLRDAAYIRRTFMSSTSSDEHQRANHPVSP